MNITYSIQNSTSESVNTVILRKFFQMVFMDNDRKSLRIYTATILGACNQSNAKPDDSNSNKACDTAHCFNQEISKESTTNSSQKLSSTLPFSDLQALRQFRMRFEFAIVANEDKNEVVDIHHEDLTNGEHGLFKEIACVRKVWGEECDILLDNEKAIIDRLTTLPGQNSSPEEIQRNAAFLVQQPLLWTEQKKRHISDDWLKSLSIQGNCETLSYDTVKLPRDEASKRSAYAISVPKEPEIIPKGLELVNWVRTEIRFKYPISEKTQINYVIKNLTKDSGFSYAPDFTWYFAPPIKSNIDDKNCLVEVKRSKKRLDTKSQCPLGLELSNLDHSDKYPNGINTVPNKLTVNFHDWDKIENIYARRKHRLACRDILPTPESFSEITEISIFLDMTDDHSRGNRQFILGLFISFALSYGIDSSRLDQIKDLFSPFTILFPPDVWWIIFLAAFSLTIVNRPAIFAKRAKPLGIFRHVILLVSLGWFSAAFAIFRSPLYEWLKSKISEAGNTAISHFMGTLLLLLIISDIIYLRLIKTHKKDSVWLELFGKDFL